MVLKREKVEQLLALKKQLKAKEREVNRTVALRAKAYREPGYDKHSRIVVVTRETDTEWWGWPLMNPRCPVLQWPKLAWEEAR